MIADAFFKVAGLAFAFFLLWILLMGYKAVQLEQACLLIGYPQSRLTVTGEGYCIRRVNQTDEVLHLERP